MAKHVHHKIARSRGGTDDEWNLVEVDPYTHAYEHALDFVKKIRRVGTTNERVVFERCLNPGNLPKSWLFPPYRQELLK